MCATSPSNFHEDFHEDFNAGPLASRPPSAPTARYAEIPFLLKQYPNWVGWRAIEREGKPTKVPFDVKTGRPAKADDPSTWASFAQVVEATDVLNSNSYDGPGFELGGTNIVGIDFDNAITNKGVIDSYALAILELLGDPYTEISPSGKGLHAFVECDALPAGGRKLSKDHTGIEIYHGKEGGRYFTITGERVRGDGVRKVGDIELPYLLITQNNDKRFKALWLGGVTANDNDDSSADFALMLRLSALTHSNPVKMENVFGASTLGRRDKWTDRPDYRQRTIKAAIKAAIKANHTGKPASDELVFTLPAVPRIKPRPYVVAPVLGQTDGWFPKGEVSLIGAPSGASKTTWLYQMLLAQHRKATFFGHATSGMSFNVMAIDRGEAAHEATMERMRLPIDAIPFSRMRLGWDVAAVQNIVNAFEELNPRPEILVIEGVDMLVSEIGSIKSVTTFMLALDQFAKHYNITVIGTLGSPKIKVGQGYIAKRDNLLGSSAWGRVCETIVNLQFPKNDDTDTRRLLFVLLRNGPAEKFTLGFDCGQLELIPDIEESEIDSASAEIRWFQEQARLAKGDPTKEWWTVLDMARALNIAPSTAANHKSDELTKRHIRCKTGPKIGKGAAAQYQWNESDSNPLWVAQQTQDDAEQQGTF